MKITVSNECYSEISIALKRLGREVNDGTVLSLEKGDAVVPPQDFRMVAIRQNCLGAAVEVFKESTGQEFLNIAQEIFDWCLNGKSDTKPEPFIEGVSNRPGQGWDKN